MYGKMKCLTMIFLWVVVMLPASIYAAGCQYNDPNHWAYYGDGDRAQDVDVFFVCPTVFFGDVTQVNMPIDDEAVRKNFIGAINMEKGIYDMQGSFYAPYYRQAGLIAYTFDQQTAAPYFETAYQDVKSAFQYYLKECNHGRPIVLAGFSQGADMIIRLMKDMYRDPRLQDQLVAAYAIGWRVTPQELEQYPQLKMAQGERDTGVIISFNTEAPEVTSSMIVPDQTLAINPLNWKTTSELAGKMLNKGAAFTGYDGTIKKEVPHLTGAYLDSKRGTLKVTDIVAADYPPILDIFTLGIYHLYDYQFFYRNLQDNVKVRINAFKERRALFQAS